MNAFEQFFKNKPNNFVDLKHEIKKNILNYLVQFRGNDDFSKNNTIIFWVTDQTNQSVMRNRDFNEWLCLVFEEEGLHNIAKAKMQYEFKEPRENNNFHKAIDGLYIEIRNLEDLVLDNISGKARITSVSGLGTLAKINYTLDATKKTTFYIGRGKNSNYNPCHINDIVIKEDETDFEQKERNMYVSSEHAAVFYERNTFFLRALPGGCRSSGGSSTKLIHSGKKDELDNMNTGLLLHDGDYIELGKKVILKFEIVKDNK